MRKGLGNVEKMKEMEQMEDKRKRLVEEKKRKEGDGYRKNKELRKKEDRNREDRRTSPPGSQPWLMER